MEENYLNKYWSRKANSIMPYTAGEQPKIKNIIKLNTNENAYPPSPHVLEAIAGAAEGLRKYPPPGADALAEAAARDAGLKSENIFCANGSDEALALSFLAFFDPGKPVFTPDITYTFYTVWADLFDLTVKQIPLRNDFTVRVDEMAGAPGGVVLANPNAPTGIALSAAEVEKIIAANSGVVIIDEAYVAFGGESVISLVPKYDNLVVIRTLSKSHALAGLRVGYAAANKNLIGALLAVRDSFNSYPVDSLAQAGGAAALDDREYYAKITAEIIRTREFTAKALRDMGVLVLPSGSNFLFIRPQVPAETVFCKLREKGIIVRWFNKQKISDFLRVSIGTMEEMKCFIREMEYILTSS
jgi:histidinol-phosphate aminotransferase